MLLRIHFGDNDFRNPIFMACKDVMYTISNGYEKHESIKKYEEKKKNHGLKNIRKAIVLASYGYIVIGEACRLYKKIEYDFSKQNHYINYLDSIITLEEVKTYDSNDDNLESCYIDFYNLTVDIV